MSKLVNGLLVVGLLGGGYVYGDSQGWFDTIPTKCDGVTASQLTHVLSNSLMGKMGLRVLTITSATDNGSKDGSLKCKIQAMTTHDDMTFDVSTKVVGNETYIEVKSHALD
jgi:hypothetical protein